MIRYFLIVIFIGSYLFASDSGNKVNKCFSEKGGYSCDEAGEIEERYGNYEKSFSLYNYNCKRGFASGCYNLGRLYLSGKGVKQSFEKTFSLYSQACNGGSPGGCTGLGGLYERGDGVEHNPS